MLKRANHDPHLHQELILCFLCLGERKVCSLGFQLVLHAPAPVKKVRRGRS